VPGTSDSNSCFATSETLAWVAPGLAGHDVACARMSHQSSTDGGSARGACASDRRLSPPNSSVLVRCWRAAEIPTIWAASRTRSLNVVTRTDDAVRHRAHYPRRCRLPYGFPGLGPRSTVDTRRRATSVFWSSVYGPPSSYVQLAQSGRVPDAAATRSVMVVSAPTASTLRPSAARR
jgi:hypothetical protein